MSNLSERLDALLDSLADQWTPEERDLAKAIAGDYTDLMARRISGQSVEGELAHVRAQGVAILAAGATTLADVIEEEVRGFLGELISDLVPGL